MGKCVAQTMRNVYTIMFVVCFIPIMPVLAQENYTDANLISEISNIRDSLDEINLSNTIGYMVGIILAVIAVAATIYNSKKLNRQLNIHEKEIRYRMRPILVRGRYADGNTFSVQKNESRIWIKVKNAGPLPATKIVRHMRGGIVKNESNPSIENEFKVTPMYSLGPNEYVDNILRLSDNEYAEMRNGSNYFFELKMEYEEPEHATKYYYHIKGHFEKENLIQDFIDMN